MDASPETTNTSLTTAKIASNKDAWSIADLSQALRKCGYPEEDLNPFEKWPKKELIEALVQCDVAHKGHAEAGVNPVYQEMAEREDDVAAVQDLEAGEALSALNDEGTIPIYQELAKGEDGIKEVQDYESSEQAGEHLDSAHSRHAPSMETTLSEVCHEPLFNALTKSGKAHFSNVKDARCELVDNSIQATKDNGASVGRTIKVFIELGPTEGSSYLVVWDNGCGMDEKGIAEFDTYFLGQRDR